MLQKRFIHIHAFTFILFLPSIDSFMILGQGSHGDWKTWKMKMVMEKSWNMKNWPKVMEFCDSVMEFYQFAPNLY